MPFGWLLAFGDPSDREAFDVSSWTEVSPDDERQVELVKTIGSIVTAIGGMTRRRGDTG